MAKTLHNCQFNTIGRKQSNSMTEPFPFQKEISVNQSQVKGMGKIGQVWASNGQVMGK